MRYRASYWKTVAAAAIGTTVAAAAVLLLPWWPAKLVLATIAALGTMVVWGGALCLRRDAQHIRQNTGLGARTNPTSTHKCRRRAKTLPIGRPLRLRLIGLRVGDVVEVRGTEEILATLDEQGSLGGLPFMPEMLRYCGQRFHVFRRVDKILDTQLKTGLRRMHNTVLLDDLRCDGGDHAGCQAGCQLLWKDDWLIPVTSVIASPQPVDKSTDPNGRPEPRRRLARAARPDGERWRCQLTELLAATTPLAWWDVRQDLRSVIYGNVGFCPWLHTIAIRLFNMVQTLRGGVTYPYLDQRSLERTPEYTSNLQPGELVEVRARAEIQNTLDRRNRNRGLYFDLDMLRYCGKRYRVQRRVDKIVDEATGRILEFRNPCIVLEGVTATHEWHRFCPQNEPIFWREIWLRRITEAESPGETASTSVAIDAETRMACGHGDERSR